MTGRTVDEAIELALKELDVDRDEAEVEILSRGKAGFLGIGAEPARVKVTKISEGPSAAALAVETVGRILSAAKVNVNRTLRSANDPEVGGPIIDLDGEDSGLLIGRRGQTLQALQFLVNLIVRKQFEDVRVALDVERYRERRESSLRDMASKVAERVVQTSRSVTLEPMSPADRRIVHTTLTDNPSVTTESTGVGDDRKVTIMPQREN
ncbi:MAG: protein jag [Chloroflexi bacterium]|nr:protein jag [Chloroflexota bacterium]MCH8224600.1 protein jag [Chloroflexota bacterium]MCI0845976.1 protein jag [Chloroflexota bacterium]